MNREIKFRGKTAEGKWVYGFYVFHKDMDAHLIVDESEGYPITYEVIPETIGQFIGRYDNAGKEIYEGEIISLNGRYNKIISFCDDHVAFCLADIGYLKCQGWKDIWEILPSLWWDNLIKDIKVIGNIHDNPELLAER